jgi:hypothetical protein
MKSIFNQSGYFLNDDRASGGRFEQDDLLGCGHCPRPVKKHKWQAQGGMCYVCGKPLCFACYEIMHKSKQCAGSQEDQIIRAVNETYHKQQNAKVLGIDTGAGDPT